MFSLRVAMGLLVRYVVILSVIAVSATGFACTTVLVSGKATVDGRPLLWKNRDTWQHQNEVLYDKSGEYAFIGVVNAEALKRVWMGTNETGFCIENSLSNDLRVQDSGGGPGNGSLIRMALESCSSVADFESLLRSTNETGRSTTGNFGVIDAKGGATMFEVGPNSYRAYDANDETVAPKGVIVRANTSITGSGKKRAQKRSKANAKVLTKEYSGLRYCRARDLCMRQLKKGKLDVRYMLQQVARDIEVIETSEFDSESSRSDLLLSTKRTLNRNTTVSAVVFHGVLPGESALCTTMWTLLGEPAFTIAVPNWVAQQKIAEPLNGDGASSICQLSVDLRNRNYLVATKRSNDQLIADQLRWIESKTLAVENETIKQTESLLVAQRQEPVSDQFWQLHQQAANSAHAGLAELCQVTRKHNRSATGPLNIVADFRFDEPNGSKLTDAQNSAGSQNWDGGLTDVRVHNGNLRIRRNDYKRINRFVDISPNVRASSDPKGEPKIQRGWIMIEVTGWNLLGSEIGECIRIGFASRAEQDIHTVGMELQRTAENEVTVSGIAFGDGAEGVTAKEKLPAKLTEKTLFVLELDKVAGNSGEGDSGGEYRMFVKRHGDAKYKPLAQPSRVRRLRNGNHLNLHVEGLFGDEGEFFDIGRIVYTTTNPIR